MKEVNQPADKGKKGQGKPASAGKPEVGASEEQIIAVRREKADKAREAGDNPFTNVVGDGRVFLRALRDRFAAAIVETDDGRRYAEATVDELADGPVRVAGRLTARRGFGKASFLEIRDASGQLQLFAKKDVMGDAFAVLKTIDVLDHVEAFGKPMVTKTGELSLQITELRLLTKAYRPPADKFKGLQDVDLRYRRRYVDFVANPDAAAVMRARTAIVQGIRRFLDDRAFMEVETPTLHQIAGGAAARPFHTHHNALDLPLFLRITPELYLKRLLVGGFERVYEIGRAYRNEGISTRHNPEFTIVEFYLAYATYETLMDMTEELLRFVDGHLAAAMGEQGLGEAYVGWKASREFTLDEPFRRLPMAQAIRDAQGRLELSDDELVKLRTLGQQGKAAPDDEARQAARKSFVDELKTRTERGAGKDAAGETIDGVDWYNLIRALGNVATDGDATFVTYEYLCEPFLKEDYRSADGSKSLPVFITDYPFEVSPLARRKDADPSLTDRFELFIDSRELCNAFSELNDPDDQAARFRDQVERKSQGADETMDYDEDYVRALEYGMPPAAGFGMGVDRLVMMLAGQSTIRDVIAFPLLRPEA